MEEKFIYKNETEKIIGLCYKIHNTLGCGHKERIYLKSLVEELQKNSFTIDQEKQIPVYYESKKVGAYTPDLVINNLILIELKAKPFITTTDENQFWSYLKGTSYKIGLLINFGKSRVEVRRRVYDTARHQNISRLFGDSPRKSRVHLANTQISRPSSGFTLVELILYIALVGILLTAAAIFATDVVLGSIKGRVRAQVHSEARFALEKMRQEIVKGKSLEAIQNSVWISGSDKLQRYDAATGSKIGNDISIPGGSHGLTYDSLQNAIWTVESSLLKIDATSGGLLNTIIPGGGRERLTHDPIQNAVWVVPGSTNNLLKYDAATDALKKSTNIPYNNSRAIAYDQTQNAIWVTSFDDDKLLKFNAASGDLASGLNTFNTGDGPKGVAYDLKQNAVWVANENANNIQKFAALNGSLLGTFAASDPYVLAYDSTQNAVWVAGGTTLEKFDAATGALLKTSLNIGSSHGITYDSVQNAIWVTGGGGLRKFDAINGNLIITISTNANSSVAYAFNCRFMLGDGTTRTSFSVNGDQKMSSLNTLQMCSESGAGCGSSDAWIDLTSPDIEVSNFTCQNISSGTSLGEEAVRIQMTLKNKNPGGKKEFDAEVTVETSIALRL